MYKTTQLIREECGQCPVFESHTLTFDLQLRKKHGKTSVRVEKPHFLYNINLLLIVKKTRALCEVKTDLSVKISPLNAELNPICHLLALLGAHPILHVSRVRVNMSFIFQMFNL